MADKPISKVCPECGDAIITGVQHECSAGEDDKLSGPPELEVPRSTPQPWDALPEENPRQYQVFTEFLRMPPPRSINSLGQRVNRGRAQLQILARQFRWWDRAMAYDSWEVNERVAKVQQWRKKAAELLLADEFKRRERLVSMADKLLERVEQYLAWPIEQVVREEKTTTDGGEVTVHKTVEPAKWNMDTVVRMVGMVELLYEKAVAGSREMAAHGTQEQPGEGVLDQFQLWQPDADLDYDGIEAARDRNLNLPEHQGKKPGANRPVKTKGEAQPNMGDIQ